MNTLLDDRSFLLTVIGVAQLQFQHYSCASCCKFCCLSLEQHVYPSFLTCNKLFGLLSSTSHLKPDLASLQLHSLSPSWHTLNSQKNRPTTIFPIGPPPNYPFAPRRFSSWALFPLVNRSSLQPSHIHQSPKVNSTTGTQPPTITITKHPSS